MWVCLTGVSGVFVVICLHLGPTLYVSVWAFMGTRVRWHLCSQVYVVVPALGCICVYPHVYVFVCLYAQSCVWAVCVCGMHVGDSMLCAPVCTFVWPWVSMRRKTM